MKTFFLYTFAALILLSIVAWKIQPDTNPSGKIPLLWVSDDNPARRDQIALFNRMYPKYYLTLDPSNTGMEKVIVQSLAGAGPDIFDCYNGFQLSAYVKSGIAWDVTDELKKRGIDVKKEVWPALFPDIFLNGRAYGVGTNVSCDAIWYNKDIFDENHVPYPKGPWTWKQFLPVAERLTKRDSNGKIIQYGLLCDFSAWQEIIGQWGGHLYSPDGTSCTLNSPQCIAAVQFLHDLIWKYHVMPSPVEEAAATAGGWGSGTISFFSAGKSAMAFGGRWWLCTLRLDQKQLRLGVVEAPYEKYHVYYGYGKSTLINRNSPHRQQALDFLVYETTKQYNDLVSHQADGFGPIIKYTYDPKVLHDPDYPNEDYNAVWRDIMKYAQPQQISPFVNGQAVDRIITKQMDLIKANQKPVPDALQTATEQINEEIINTVKQDPELLARYEKLTGRIVQ
jgi:multiple sugar transport system substrate-binding protein